ncbi:fungal-specific transcription factor domain-containing protein [Phaeosphaeria sp. MPI-PUGE-AT-0046c]|nr:fungal-specific transcription factor domain-containing protein [Phaeosphaeria sp. MPI-PUGE-AT-0046c]
MNSATEQLRPPKRQKTVLACHNCRARKVRCSGQRPHCSTCITRRETSTCAYDDIALAIEINDNNGQQSAINNIGLPSTNGPSSQPVASPPPPGLRDEVRHSTNSQPVDWNGNTIAPTRNPWCATSPWTASMNGASPAQRSQQTEVHSVSESLLPQSDLGLSNSGGFLKAFVDAASTQSERSAASRQRAPLAKTLAQLGIADHPATATHRFKLHPEDLLLPTRREMTRLLGVYQRTHYPIFPIFDMHLVMGEADALFNGTAHILSDRTLHCILNFIFALSTQSHPPEGSTDDEDAADPFLKRGQNLLSTNFLDGFSFSQLQTTLICSQYLLSTDRLQQAWLMVGSSMRLAEALGLDRTSTTEGLRDEHERSLAKRVWHACVSMDRTVSMCTGQRPSSSPHATAFVTLDPYSPNDMTGIQTMSPELAHDFFRASSKLFDNLHEILTRVYVPNDKRGAVTPSDFVTTACELEHKLVQWEERLPRALQPPLDDFDNGLFCYASHFLKQRFLQARIMLYRPSLGLIVARNASASSSKTMLNSSLVYAATSCIASSQEMIGLCQRQTQGLPESQMLTPWWMNLLYIYTAAVAIAAALMTHSLTGRLDMSSLHRSMEEAITMIQHYAKNKSAAKRCLVTLTGILQLQFPQSTHIENDAAAYNPAFAESEQNILSQHDLTNEANAQVFSNMGWARNGDEMQNAAVFGYFSDAWLTQPSMDHFDFLGL